MAFKVSYSQIPWFSSDIVCPINLLTNLLSRISGKPMMDYI